MKSPLKVLLTVVAFGVAASIPALQAQEQKKGGGRGQMTPEQQIERLETAVGKLSADQTTKIKAIYAKLASDMQALSQEDRRTKGQELRTAANKEIRALLTKEQAEKFDAMPQGGRGGGGGKKKAQ